MIYDRDGNLIAEADAATGATKREYIWLGSRPVAVVDGVDTPAPQLLAVHADHLDRPVMMIDAGGRGGLAGRVVCATARCRR